MREASSRTDRSSLGMSEMEIACTDEALQSQVDVFAGRDRPPDQPSRQAVPLASDNNNRTPRSQEVDEIERVAEKPTEKEHAQQVEGQYTRSRLRQQQQEFGRPELEASIEFLNGDVSIEGMNGDAPTFHSRAQTGSALTVLQLATSCAAHPSGIDATPSRVCNDNVDELAIVVDPPASSNTTEKGNKKSDFVSWICQGFGGLYFLFYAVALVGVMPRCIVLLASHALPQAPPSQAVAGFLDLWQSCTNPANAFSDFSSRGLVYKMLVGADHLILLFGFTLACVAALWLVFPDASQSRHGAWRLGLTAAVCFLLWASYCAVMLSTLINENASLAAIYLLGGHRQTFTFLTLAATYVGYVYVATGFGSKMWRCCLAQDAGAVFWRKLYVIVGIVGTATVVWQIAKFLSFFEHSLAGKIDSAIATSTLCRALNFLVRWLINCDHTLPVHAVNVVSMLLLSSASIAIRRIILAQSNQNPWLLLVSCLKLASLEVLGRCAAYFVNIIRIGRHMQGLNVLTLEGLADVHTRVQREVEGLTTYMLVDQFIEVFVFVMITAQDLSAPIWSYIRIWWSMEAYTSRGPYILLECAIQMSVEFSVDLLVWRLCFRTLDWDLPQIIRRVVFKKPVAVVTVGMMLMHSLNFYPFCMDCGKPVSCLVFTECLFDGEVMMDGQNACTAMLRHDQKYANFAVQEMLARTQVKISAEQLGCGRQDVDCFGLEEGRK